MSNSSTYLIVSYQKHGSHDKNEASTAKFESSPDLLTGIKEFLTRINFHKCRDRSGLWGKKAPFKGKIKSTFLAKKKKKKSTFGAEKKHLVNIILLTKSNKKVLTIKLFSLFFICMINVSQGKVPSTL